MLRAGVAADDMITKFLTILNMVCRVFLQDGGVRSGMWYRLNEAEDVYNNFREVHLINTQALTQLQICFPSSSKLTRQRLPP